MSLNLVCCIEVEIGLLKTGDSKWKRSWAESGQSGIPVSITGQIERIRAKKKNWFGHPVWHKGNTQREKWPTCVTHGKKWDNHFWYSSHYPAVVLTDFFRFQTLLCYGNCLLVPCMYYCVPGTVSPVCITMFQELSHLYVLLCSRNCLTCMYYYVPGTVSPVCITVFQELSHLYILLCSRNCLTCMYYCVPGTVSPVCITMFQELSHLYVLLCSRNCLTCMYYCVPGTVSPVCITMFQELSFLYVLLCSRNCLTCMYYCVPGTVSSWEGCPAWAHPRGHGCDERLWADGALQAVPSKSLTTNCPDDWFKAHRLTLWF